MKLTRRMITVVMAAPILATLACAWPAQGQSSLHSSPYTTQDPGHVYDPGHDQGLKKEWKGDPYLLAVDPVSGATLGPIEKQVVVQHEGRELRFATQENADAFKAKPEKFLLAVDEKIVRAQLPLYPLDTCVVSGRKLGEVGEPDNFVYKNRLVRLSTKDGELAFLQDPKKYIDKLDAAVIAKQGPSYGMKTCPVSGEKLDGEMGAPVDYVIGNRLVRLCCKDCKEKLLKDPLKFLKLEEPDKKPQQGAK